MISETNRFIHTLENIPKADKNATATITIRITSPKSIDADKACRKFIKKQIKKFKKEFEDFADDLDLDCETIFR